MLQGVVSIFLQVFQEVIVDVFFVLTIQYLSSLDFINAYIYLSIYTSLSIFYISKEGRDDLPRRKVVVTGKESSCAKVRGELPILTQNDGTSGVGPCISKYTTSPGPGLSSQPSRR